MGDPEKTVESAANQPAPAMAAAGDRLRKRRNNVAVMVLLGLDVLLGAGIAVAGYAELESDAITLAGAGLATIGVILMLVFQLVGREK